MGILNDWLNRKLHISVNLNFTYLPAAGVISSSEPRSIRSTNVKVSNKSNFRFCLYEVKEPGDLESRAYYYTEMITDGKWKRVENTWFANKDKAMDAHLKVVNGQDMESKTVETVLFEGLDKEETAVWVALNSKGQYARK